MASLHASPLPTLRVPADPGKRTRRAMWVANFVAVFGVSLVIPFLPLYIQELGVRDPKAVKYWTGLLYSVTFLGAAIMAPIWGSIADRIGRKQMTLRAIAGLAVSIGLMYWATNVSHLLFLRILQGLLSGFIPSAIALVAGATRRDEVGTALGILQTAIVTGQILGPAAGGMLADRIGFPPLFLGAGVLCLAAGVVVAFFVERDTPSPAADNPPGIRTQIDRLMRSPELRRLFVVLGLTHAATMGMLPILPLLIQETLTPSTAQIATWVGLVVAAHAPASFIASPLWGRAGDRHGHVAMIVWAEAGAACFAFPQALAPSLALLGAARFAMGFFTSGVAPLAHGRVGKETRTEELAATLGLLTSAQFLGSVCGPLLASGLAVSFGTRSVFLAASLLFLAAMLLLQLPRSSGRRQSFPTP